jgi:hypothetical protein
VTGSQSQQLYATVSQHVESVHQSARSCPAGGGGAWDDVLRHYQLGGVGDSERRATVQAMGIESGAVPAEVRMVFEALARWASYELGRLGGDPQLDVTLKALPQREVARYLAQLPHRPAAPAPAQVPQPAPAAGAPALASIFQNATEAAQQTSWANAQPHDAVLTCPHCGGPQEEIGNFLCGYCQRPLGG